MCTCVYYNNIPLCVCPSLQCVHVYIKMGVYVDKVEGEQEKVKVAVSGAQL